ncbi:amino acid permease [Pseudomonas sp. BN102]|uniref:APC family permease n=1 Tax=Pseudomonas sp. BN102 TaxID=2567886 RepID=UPI0024544D17|nr:amino acid permease [Pseudomonas sp. BN102]MDH4608448.1 amino acid permease [Pseudomonas sp. BN102]
MQTTKRNIGSWSLMLTGLGSIIGSGWLFGAWHASAIAGPAAILAWIIGAVVVLAIALTYAEMGAMFPESGGMVRYARYSHGSLVGFMAALPIFFYFQAKSGWKGFSRDLRAAAWLIGYLPVMAAVLYLGSKEFGGIGLLPAGWDMAVVAVLALAFYHLGVRSGYRTHYLDESVVWRMTAEENATASIHPAGATERPAIAQQ